MNVENNIWSIAAARENGMLVKDIASAIGTSEANVTQRLRKHGLRPNEQIRQRDPTFESVLAAAKAERLYQAAALLGISRPALSERLARIGTNFADCKVVARLTPTQLDVYREALDVGLLPHPDALELALEYDGGLSCA